MPQVYFQFFPKWSPVFNKVYLSRLSQDIARQKANAFQIKLCNAFRNPLKYCCHKVDNSEKCQRQSNES